MGKHKKSTLSTEGTSSPSEEKRKIRQSILNLFQKHFQAEENAVSLKHAVKENTLKRQSQPSSSSSDSIDRDPRMGSQDEILRRKRRRKTKAERNKTRSKSASCQATEERADMNRHLKTAHSVSYPLRSKGQTRDESNNAITQSRLTKRLGLFNKSKKSGTVLRGPIVLTESLRKETEEDLKKILNVTDERREVAMETDHESMGRMSNPSSSASHHLPAVLYEPQARVKITPTNLSKPSYSHSLSSLSRELSLCPSSEEIDDFPEEPPMEEIVQLLANKIEDHKMFKGMDIARDLCNDLNRLMKHNAPRESTPALTRVGRALPSSSTSSVCRSLIDSFTPIHVTRNCKPVQAERPMSVTLSPEHPSVPQKTRDTHNQVSSVPREYNFAQASSTHPASSIKDLVVVAHMENIASKVRQNQTENMSAIDMLKRNDNLCLQREISCTVSNPQTAKNLLSIPTREQYFDPSNFQSTDRLSQPNKENLLNVMQVDSQSIRSYSSQDRLTNSQSSGFHSHHSVTDLTTRPDLNNPNLLPCNNPLSVARHMDPGHTHEPHQAVLTEYNKDTQYMPRFHGDFYKDSLWFEKTILSSIDQVSNPSQNSRNRDDDHASSMDILDFIDRNSQASVEVLSGQSRNLSPKWQEPTYVLPPQTLSPDSPQMLPRRLY